MDAWQSLPQLFGTVEKRLGTLVLYQAKEYSFFSERLGNFYSIKKGDFHD
jgi:hypothetical protein